MATRSNIGLQNLDGTVEYVYSHWDGDLSWNGVLLHTHYNSEKQVRELLARGNISSLGKRITPEVWEEHNFNNPADNVTTFYGRDRGDEDVSSVHVDSLLIASSDMQEYMYIYDVAKQEWLVMQESKCGWKKLAKLV
jgi:hypothetical protein